MELLSNGAGTKFPLSRVLRERALAFLRTKTTDTLISYEEISAAMDVDPREDMRARSAFLKASRDLLYHDLRKVENVRDVGYRIVRDDERRRVAHKEEKSSHRKLKRAYETLTQLALDNLPPQEVALLLTDQARVAIQLAVRKRVQRVKQLPPKDEIKVPNGAALVKMFEKKANHTEE